MTCEIRCPILPRRGETRGGEPSISNWGRTRAKDQGRSAVRGGDAEYLSGLRDGQPGEIAKLHQFGGLRVVRSEPGLGLVQCQQVLAQLRGLPGGVWGRV